MEIQAWLCGSADLWYTENDAGMTAARADMPDAEGGRAEMPTVLPYGEHFRITGSFYI